MFELRNPKIAVPVVLFAGLIWSFGPLVVRYMDDPHLIPWQYIFGRGLTIFILLNLYLFFEEGKNFYKNYFRIGVSGLIGLFPVIVVLHVLHGFLGRRVTERQGCCH